MDYDTPENNHFLAVRELWIQGMPYRRRPDVLGFVNGLPLLFIELKAHHKSVKVAYENNLSDYLVRLQRNSDLFGVVTERRS